MNRVRVTHVEQVTREIEIDVPDSVSADEYHDYLSMQCFGEGQILEENPHPDCETMSFEWEPVAD